LEYRTKGVRIARILNDFVGFVLREGSVNLPPPRDCDRDERRNHATVPPQATWEGAATMMTVSQETWTKPKHFTTFFEGGRRFL